MFGRILTGLSLLVTGGIALGTVPAGRNAAAAEPQPEAAFYVATDGNDAWSGRLPARNADRSDGPFATLTKARDALREIDRKQRNSPLVVMVRGGKYFLDETFVLGSQDAGTRDSPVVFMAYPGEKPVLSGGRKVTGWEPYQGEIFQCALPGSKGGKWKFRRLYADGQPQTRARWPNFDPANPIQGGWAKAEGPAQPDSQRAFRYKPGTFPRRWAKPTEGEVNIFYGNFGDFWGNDIVPIKGIDEANRVITLVRPTRDFDRPSWFWPTPFQPDTPFVVENLLEELDQPGEWCLDSEEGKLYFWPPGGSIEGLEVVAPVLDRLVALHRTSFVTIRGFTFSETADGDEPHPGGVEGLGAMFPASGTKYVGEALHLNRAEWCRVEDNHFDAVGGNAIYLQGYNARNVIRRNEIGHAGANGIGLGGQWGHGDFLNEKGNLSPIGRAAADDPVELPPRNPHVQRDRREPHPPHRRDQLLLGRRLRGPLRGQRDRAQLDPRRLAPRRQPRQQRAEPQHRRIQRHPPHLPADYRHRRDQLLGRRPERNAQRQGHIIRYNLIVEPRGHGVYLDDYTSNCFVYGNVIVRPTEVGFVVHGGKNNVIENNMIIGANNAVSYIDAVSGRTPEMAGFSRGNRFCRNIVVGCKGTILHKWTSWTDRVVAQSDENLFFDSPDAQPYLDSRRRMGFEAHSLIADPLFVDPARGDYRLKPGSPALRLGFQPVDFDRIGRRDAGDPLPL